MKCMQRIPLWKDKGPYGKYFGSHLGTIRGQGRQTDKVFGMKSAESDNMEFLATSWTPYHVLSCWAHPNKRVNRQLAGDLPSLDGHLRDSLITQFREWCFCRTEGLTQCHLKGLWPVIISLPDSNFLFLWRTGCALCANSLSLFLLLHRPFTFFIWNRPSKQTDHLKAWQSPKCASLLPPAKLPFIVLLK